MERKFMRRCRLHPQHPTAACSAEEKAKVRDEGRRGDKDMEFEVEVWEVVLAGESEAVEGSVLIGGGRLGHGSGTGSSNSRKTGTEIGTEPKRFGFGSGLEPSGFSLEPFGFGFDPITKSTVPIGFPANRIILNFKF
ncbi:hypothetical protein JCGZ_22128 [Jatropha curcas]|uniref:Uncharacterized protein n=1 Tax=Jatropha curcas TaxID=180498 RepID=A0A067LFF4_JATCU|nr:hypothetical protein JCGZ_22128 [Jatropha curcas]